MPDREQLIELLEKYKTYDSAITKVVQRPMVENLADYLLENDVTKVIRCENCKHWKPCGDGRIDGLCWALYLYHDGECYTKSYHFCGYGELKECEG